MEVCVKTVLVDLIFSSFLMILRCGCENVNLLFKLSFSDNLAQIITSCNRNFHIFWLGYHCPIYPLFTYVPIIISSVYLFFAQFYMQYDFRRLINFGKKFYINVKFSFQFFFSLQILI